MIKYCFIPNKFEVDLIDIAKIFAPSEQYESSEWQEALLKLSYNTTENFIFFNAQFYDKSYEYKLEIGVWNNLIYNRYIKRYAKICLYNCLKNYYKKELAWGSLTGIRPTKFARDLDLDWDSDLSQLNTVYDISDNKINVLRQVLTAQREYINTNPKAVDVYVGIPFCTSICNYCSFSSGLISNYYNFVEPFINTLQYEIISCLELIKKCKLEVNSIYFGGGTPTSLSCEQLNRLLSLFNNIISKEFTVEAGRPDTIDSSKLQMLADNNVNRISINPQSFNDATLKAVGRSHSVEQIYQAYNLARKFNFNINMDLIAGLSNESVEQFNNSILQTYALKPDNITVHTLSIKRGSKLATNSEFNSSNVSQMTDNAFSLLTNNGYLPYYLYRQKYTYDNLENIGYCLKNKQCLYNINTMEESINIIACGCNAISKKLFNNKRIERYANPKDVLTYINKVETIINNKEMLFKIN